MQSNWERFARNYIFHFRTQGDIYNRSFADSIIRMHSEQNITRNKIIVKIRFKLQQNSLRSLAEKGKQKFRQVAVIQKWNKISRRANP